MEYLFDGENTYYKVISETQTLRVVTGLMLGIDYCHTETAKENGIRTITRYEFNNKYNEVNKRLNQLYIMY